MVRDQLTENINAAMELRNCGKTVLAAVEYAAESKNSGLNFTGDTFVKEAVEAGHFEGETVEKE